MGLHSLNGLLVDLYWTYIYINIYKCLDSEDKVLVPFGLNQELNK